MSHEQPQVVVKQKGGPGCLKLSLSFGCGGPLFFCAGIVGIVIVLAVLVQAGKESATEKAIERNNGYGSFEKPISEQRWADFENGNVRVTRIIRPADAMIEDFNQFNDDAPAGAEYVLAWFELKCEADECRPRALDLRLMDKNEKAWGEPWILVLDDDFDSNKALRGATIAGWQGFAFPKNEEVQTIKIEWNNETLHIKPPAD